MIPERRGTRGCVEDQCIRPAGHHGPHSGTVLFDEDLAMTPERRAEIEATLRGERERSIDAEPVVRELLAEIDRLQVEVNNHRTLNAHRIQADPMHRGPMEALLLRDLVRDCRQAVYVAMMDAGPRGLARLESLAERIDKALGVEG